MKKLKQKAHAIRKEVLAVCTKANAGHVSSSMSCIEILVALYYGGILNYDPKNPQWPQRDRLILSKAQGSPTLYCILADIGFFPKERMSTFAKDRAGLSVHVQGDVPGVEISGGSLGHGFGVGAGMALAAKMNRELHMIFCILGDGELYEGVIWETAMFAAHNRLNNLVVIIDRNFLCVTDFTENLLALEPLEDKWRSFGWEVARVDGNDMGQIMGVLEKVRSRRSSKPVVVIADTVKGKGISSLCYSPMGHGMVPKGKEAEIAAAELERNSPNE